MAQVQREEIGRLLAASPSVIEKLESLAAAHSR
jgi:hypothetical protein